MIYTLTLNPSLDYVVTVKDFEIGKTNRTTEEQVLLGGKGINVSMVLNNLSIENVALGFVAGFTGEELIRKSSEAGIKSDFIRLSEGITRINVKLKNYDGTEINAAGPVINEAAMELLFRKLEAFEEGDVLVLAGSVPKGVSETIYSDMMEKLSGRGIRFVVDTTGNNLLNSLKYQPFLIKPNNHELGDIFGVKLTERSEVVPYAKRLKEMGAVNVLVSMAGSGAVLVDEQGGVYETAAPEGKVINAVGAGDSMVAGFMAGYMKTGNYNEAFRLGVAAGSASAFSEELATGQEICNILKTF